MEKMLSYSFRVLSSSELYFSPSHLSILLGLIYTSGWTPLSISSGKINMFLQLLSTFKDYLFFINSPVYFHQYY